MSKFEVYRDFFKAHLPNFVLAQLDLNTVHIENTEHIGFSFSKRYSDLIFKANFKGREGYLMLLVENQSEPDNMMVFRFWEYCSLIWRKEVDDGRKKLPVVYPLMLYTGKRKYPYSTSLLDLFEEEDQHIARHAILRPLKIIDLERMSYEEIAKHGESSLQEMLYKLKNSDKPVVEMLKLSLEQYLSVMINDKDGTFCRSVLDYLSSVRGDDEPVGEFYRAADEIAKILPKKAGDIVMTFKQQMIAEGEAKGKLEGELMLAKKVIK